MIITSIYGHENLGNIKKRFKVGVPQEELSLALILAIEIKCYLKVITVAHQVIVTKRNILETV